jgi:membrane-associated phospholipid phosphatase
MKRATRALAALGGATLATVGVTAPAWAQPSGTAQGAQATAGSRSGQTIIDWNKALLAVVKSPVQPASIHPTRSFAILHAAMYDAVDSITRQGQPYLFSITAPGSASADVAAAQAGHDVLVGLYPTQQAAFDQLLATELGRTPDGAAKQQGVLVGQTVATLMLALRAGDGSAVKPPAFAPTGVLGSYLPTPPKNAAPVFTGWARVTPFVLRSATQFLPASPPSVASSTFAQSLNQVESLGAVASTTRTALETTDAKWWAPPVWDTWNEIAEGAALSQHTSLFKTAQMFSDLNLSIADTVIAFYDAKYDFLRARPVTLIRAGASLGNAAIAANPAWTPLSPTAPDPSFPGAHASVSYAASTILSSFLGNHVHISATSDTLALTLKWTSFQQAAQTASLSRIWAGQHTSVDENAGQALGTQVAQFVLKASRQSSFGHGFS